ncbi:ribosomal RNA-processing protein 12 [Rhodofomes roseus]|uniref:Ribosomal RNA-processing protein 12 n=1 Tax=Rhodofomes roseus TaxID=34475 RepID=A0ABQ8KM19_9APHY|nr:ribosomal RNA-processing protein 12 [Rhodofomes roseus]KAH9839369.1 ribosomal RNA-processing protein 12 [Rhodofomes roseus]
MADSLETALAKIRPHTSSSLPHQKTPATLLHALEATFREQNTQPSPTAYFAALLTTIEGALQAAPTSGPPLGDGDVLPAILYLLALVTPHVSHPVIRAHLDTTISLTSPLFPTLVSHAPPLRSQLGLYGAIFQALERPQLESQGLRQSFNFILQLTLDPRPKVRKKACEIVKEVLANPPAPLLQHPYAQRVADWSISALGEVNTGAPVKFKGKKAETDNPDTAIHLLAFLRPVLPTLPAASLPSLTSSLLLLPRLGNPYLAQSAYSLLSDLLSSAVDDPSSGIREQLSDILDAVLSSSPAKTDTVLAPVWAAVLGNAMLALYATDSEKSAKDVNKAWKAAWPLLEFQDTETRKAAAQALNQVGQCFAPSLIKSALAEKAGQEKKSVIGKIVAQTTKAFDALSLARSILELLAVVSSLIDNLRYRGGSRTSPTASEQLLLPLIAKVGDLRVQKTFEYKEAADATLSTAMRVLGPEVLLKALPLDLEPADRQAGREPRAFLLPLLSQPHPSPLGHFLAYFVPLTERMFDLQQTAESAGRKSEAKVWSVLVEQIWQGLPGYCWGPPDLQKALTPEFAQLLSQLLYNQTELRPAILRALKTLIESNLAIASGDLTKLPESVRVDVISEAEAEQNVKFLRGQAESWLAVLFNVFSSAGRDSQGMVGDVVSVWAGIAGEQEIARAYIKLVDLFKQNLVKTSKSAGAKGLENITAVTQDLLVLVLPHLSSVDATALFDLCLKSEVLESRDNGVQKRGYKILAKLVEGEKATVDVDAVLRQLDGVADGLAAAAKKDRFQLLTRLVPLIPPAHLHLMLSVIPEAVLGTKEPSEKARNVAFDLIVVMGKKMNEGGVVKRSAVDGMDQDGAPEATASLDEYMTMIAGGLAGATPHMISATVTAISRLVFEFKDSLSLQMQKDIFTTLLVFVTSANREIVKSVLGFVKLAIHTMAADLLRPHLKELVPALLRWSHDHKNHFKAKVRHIFERMLRRFGWEDVYACAGEEDARKVLVNIKKRKDRAKRKKAMNADNEDEEEPASKPSGGDAFEDVLYGSESELDDSDDDVPAARNARSEKSKNNSGGARIRMDDNEPMDLLHGAAARLTNAKGGKRRKPGQDAARFKTDEDSGKMVIDEDEEAADEVAAADDAYKESLTSADGFTRGPNGRIKFNKDTKKRRRENEEADADVEMGEADAAGGKKNKRRTEAKLGQEFKAKKAGGDVKKGGVEPYAYLSLSQAAKKQGRKRVGIAGKR